MENGDDWFALDKLYHLVFGFCTAIVFTLFANRTRYAFIRTRSIWVGSILSLLAGAAKETADEMGYFKSAGASVKDAVFDLLGTLMAALALSIFRSYNMIQVGGGHEYAGQIKNAVEMV
ncbi:OLC1v1014599C1 [Oldenlandia corymbosa var. corymbosa]|uniref:OLC1v1014599C1 n=1 Tax=Oldenlandia corymbosa var. corymbosa TaxID=529605 RepID=A0AAV1E1U6_OLDCO|nr:OLC1v1014599C1 [Oldenlandia corymbosa var. corymbosa]